MSSLPSPTLVSLEKKRARDRRAQRNSRLRKNVYISALESQLNACRDQSTSYLLRIQDLESTCYRLREKNLQLLEQPLVDGGVGYSWQAHAPYPNTYPRSFHSMSPQLIQGSPCDESQSLEERSHQPTTSRASKSVFFGSDYCSAANEPQHAFPSVTDIASQYPMATPWSLTPLRGRFVWDTLPTHSPWGADLQLALESPEYPSPLEILYGSKSNKLANIIHEITRVWRGCEAERLAAGWLGYAFAKWMAEPSKPRFERLPDFLKPVPDQLRHAHPICIDSIAFPQLRSNLITKPNLYDLDEVLSMLSCCTKVRWPWGKNFLTPSDGGELHFLPEFFNTFMCLDGWGLTEEFINKYPELLDEMDVRSLCYKIA